MLQKIILIGAAEKGGNRLARINLIQLWGTDANRLHYGLPKSEAVLRS
jgi:hypothetical protein